MDLRKLKTLIDLVSDSNVSELEITEAEGKVRIVKSMGVAQPVVMQQVAPVAAAPVVAAPVAPVEAPVPVAAPAGHAVTLIDEATQQNAALVEQMAAAASGLKEQAKELVGVVTVFRLAT